MTGKVPGLPPELARLRVKGAVQVHWSPKWQRYIAKRWPRPRPSISAKTRAQADKFTGAVKLIKNATPFDIVGAEALTQNSPFYVRDVLMQAAFGNLLYAVDKQGTVWNGRSIVLNNIQQLLDSISSTTGAVLVRTATAWQALLPGTDGAVLSIDPATHTPGWQQFGTSVSAFLDAITSVQGSVLFRGATEWLALAPGTAGDVFTSGGPAADPAWAVGGGGGGAAYHPGYQVGRYYTLDTATTAPALITSTAGRMFAHPVYIEADITIDALAIHTTSAGGNYRLGIYTNNSGKPDVRELDAGALSNAASGFHSITGLAFALTKGWHWLACLGDGAHNMEAFGSNVMWPFLGLGSSFATLTVGLHSDPGYGALPAAFGAITYDTINTPIIGFAV